MVGNYAELKGRELTELAITNKTSESVLLPKLSRWMPGPSLVSFKIFSFLSFNFRLWKVLHNILDLELFILGKLRPSAKRVKKWIIAAIDPFLIWDSFNFCSGACFSKSPVTFRAGKGPTPGLACAWTIHFKRCQCEDFGSHTVLWLISHFYFLLYDVFAIRLLSVIFFFQYFFARVWSFLTCNCFLKKGKQADEQSLKKGLWSWCSSNLGHVLS